MEINRGLLLLCGLCAALGACSDGSSTHVVVVVDNSIDGKNTNPNLIVGIFVKDDDAGTPAAPAPAPRLEGSERDISEAPPAPPVQEQDLAYLALAADGSALGIAGADSSARLEISDLTWSFDGARLFLAGRDQLYSSDRIPGVAQRWSEPRPLIALDGASAADGGPALEVENGGESVTVEVIAAIGRAGPEDMEDVFAIYVDAAGKAIGIENLTRTPEVRELDAAWSSDGTRLAVLERSDRDTIVLRRVSFGARIDAGSTLPAHAELEAGGVALWEGGSGTLRDVSAARTHDLLAVSAWTGRDWDVLCLDGRGRAVTLGRSGLDELSPSWSRDDRRLALEQRCAEHECAPLPILIRQLDYSEGSDLCPRISSTSVLGSAGGLPAWRR